MIKKHYCSICNSELKQINKIIKKEKEEGKILKIYKCFYYQCPNNCENSLEGIKN